MRKSVFDGRMIGLNGEIVQYPKWLFLTLQNLQRHLNRIAKANERDPERIIERDRESGFWKVLPAARKHLDPILSLPDIKLRKLAASNPGYHSGRAKRSGRKGRRDLLETGLNALEYQVRKLIQEIEDQKRSR